MSDRSLRHQARCAVDAPPDSAEPVINRLTGSQRHPRAVAFRRWEAWPGSIAFILPALFSQTGDLLKPAPKFSLKLPPECRIGPILPIVTLVAILTIKAGSTAIPKWPSNGPGDLGHVRTASTTVITRLPWSSVHCGLDRRLLHSQRKLHAVSQRRLSSEGDEVRSPGRCSSGAHSARA